MRADARTATAPSARVPPPAPPAKSPPPEHEETPAPAPVASIDLDRTRPSARRELEPPRASEPPPPRPSPAPAPPPRGSFDAIPAIASVDVRGPLPGSVIRRAVERALPSYRRCYREAARGAGTTPAGTVHIRFEIGETRAAQNIAVRGGPLPAMSACLARASTQIRSRIPPDIGTAQVTVAVRFSPTTP